jgi:carbamoyl-phosphate synthase large subunit
MAGEALASMGLKEKTPRQMSVKEAVMPFARFPGVDVVLGPEMKSTGEVMGIDSNFERAFAKSQIAAGVTLPSEGTVFVSVRDSDKEAILKPVRDLIAMGFRIVATGGTATHLQQSGLEVNRINKVYEGRPHIVDAMKDGTIALVFNTTEGAQALKDSQSIRRTALMQRIPYYTTIAGAAAAAQSISALRTTVLDVAPLQSYAN